MTLKLIRALLCAFVLFLPISAISQGLSGSSISWEDLLVQSFSGYSPVDVPNGTNENWEGGAGSTGTNNIVQAAVWVDGKLYIAGRFTAVSGVPAKGIAIFDGRKWSGLDEGVDGEITSLLVVGEDLYIGGDFTKVGELQTRDIARYDMATGTWHTLGKGIGGLFGSRVLSMAHDGERLYAGGYFIVAGTTVAVNIAAWDGRTWSRVGTGADQLISALHYDGEYLYAGGNFSIIGDRRVGRIARYSPSANSWEGMPGATFTAGDAIAAITSDDRYVYLGGRFSKFLGSDFNNVARYNRSTGQWDDMKGGVTNQRKSEGAALEVDADGLGPMVVYAMTMRGDDLFVGGDFDNLVSNPRLNADDAMNQPRDMAKWNSVTETWSMFPRPNVDRPELPGFPSSGVIKSSRKLNSSSDLTAFVPRDDQSTRVRCFAPADGDRIFIGGYFDVAGPVYVAPDVAVEASRITPGPEAVYASNICMLSEADTLWSQVGGNIVDAPIHTLADDGTYVYAGGDFVRIGDLRANHIVRLDKATGEWSDLAGGVGRTSSGALRVEEVTLFDGDLYVGGNFQTAGGLPIEGLGRWDIQSRSWSNVGGRSFTRVTAFATDGSILAVAGEHGLAVWDGSTWEDITDTIDGIPYALAIDGRNVYVGGEFNSIGGAAARNVAVYNLETGTWDAMSGGLTGPVYALEAWNEYIYVGGNFTYLGATDLIRWNRGPKRWEWVGSGLIPFTTEPNAVYALHRSTWGLYIGGSFVGYGTGATGNRAASIALWDGESFRTLGNGVVRTIDLGEVRALASDAERLHVGGVFDYAGADQAQKYAEWIFPLPEESPSGDLKEMRVASAATPHPDDIYWDDRFNPEQNFPGFDNEVFAMAETPEGDAVYVGGVFTNVLGVQVTSIARWDNIDWEPLHDGVEEGIDGFVFAIAVDGDNVWVGGQFTRAGSVPAENIALWNRKTRTWSALGQGIESDGTTQAFVSDIVVDGGNVYVAGTFAKAGGVPMQNIARWDGGGWSGLGTGIDGNVNALKMHEGKLFAGGQFGKAGSVTANSIAWWDGGTWHAAGSGVVGRINDFEVFEGELILGGSFTAAGDVDSANSAHNLARFDGTDILQFTIYTADIQEVRTLLVDERRIYTGGNFTFHPDPTHDQQKFDYGQLVNVGYQYRGFPDTVNGRPRFPFTPWIPMKEGANAPVNAFARLGDKILVGGAFTKVGEVDATYIAGWDITERRWEPLISGQLLGPISAMALVDGTLYSAGPFSNETTGNDGLATNHIARLGTGGWHREAGLIQGDALIANASGEELLLGGRFITGGDVIAVNILSWNRTDEEWKAITPGSGVASQADVSWVRGIVEYGDTLYVGGSFNVVDTFETPNVALYDRAGKVWKPLGEGLDNAVWSIAVAPDGTLYAAGDFRNSGSTPLNRVARWNGTAWEPLGEGIENGVARSIAVGDGRVFVGGTFTKAGGVDVQNVAAWNIAEERWESVGNGLTSNLLPGVEVLRFIGGRLFAGGFFRVSGPDSLHNIARFNGSRWEPLGSGLDFASFEIVGTPKDIYVAGSFAKAGSKPSPYIALWHDPTLSVEPARPTFAGSLLGTPNPTAGPMVIRYTLPSPTDGRIVITDATGRDVVELVSGRMNAGEHTLEWLTEGLAAGMYICRLVTEDGTTVEKIVVRN